MTIHKTTTFHKKEALLLAILVGLSELYFLYFFEAYGIQTGKSYSGHGHLFRTIAFGALSSGWFLLADFYIRKLVPVKTILHELIWYICLVFIGSLLTFLLFNYFWNFTEWSARALYLILKEYPLMMVFPFTLYVLIRWKTNNKGKEDLSLIRFESENQKEAISIGEDHFLFARSADNYVEVIYLKQGKEKCQLLRNSLKNIEGQLAAFDQMKRCHRSYLINRHKIENAYAKNSKLFLTIGEHSIPVSTTYRKDFDL